MAEFMTHRRAVKGLSGYVHCDICQFVIAGLRDTVGYIFIKSQLVMFLWSPLIGFGCFLAHRFLFAAAINVSNEEQTTTKQASCLDPLAGDQHNRGMSCPAYSTTTTAPSWNNYRFSVFRFALLGVFDSCNLIFPCTISNHICGCYVVHFWCLSLTLKLFFSHLDLLFLQFSVD